jgi:hypothetical protein
MICNWTHQYFHDGHESWPLSYRWTCKDIVSRDMCLCKLVPLTTQVHTCKINPSHVILVGDLVMWDKVLWMNLLCIYEIYNSHHLQMFHDSYHQRNLYGASWKMWILLKHGLLFLSFRMLLDFSLVKKIGWCVGEYV